ncbi:methyltransferase domain-containing protein [Pontibacter sp. JH31]|uniref:Methyltransferase domain-containing protein n=1 Tax=Pontibacter aquaedesilientis TaxID=2766980 RepID=A0ABR7XFN4_9BACT|nr:class I SAM-dependent methyltransferase [Pontibacter aquaedesilientis]MBD1397101.1 methyltransferase domain-containing protein [Pontibacter aquaedesilientis]
MKRIPACLSATWLFALFLALPLGACQAQETNTQSTASGYSTKSAAPGGTGKVYMGREIAAIMTTTGGSWLDRDTRQEEENSALTIKNMGLQPNSVVADIGAGTGFYTFQIAPKVPEGKVYAVEVQDRFISSLKERQKKLGAANVEVVKGGSQSINLPDNSVDIALMVDVYHELEHPREMLQAIRKALKPDGKLLLLEYRAEDPDVRIRALHKMSAAQVQKELEANGFQLQRREDFLPIQHFLLFEKK